MLEILSFFKGFCEGLKIVLTLEVFFFFLSALFAPLVCSFWFFEAAAAYHCKGHVIKSNPGPFFVKKCSSQVATTHFFEGQSFVALGFPSLKRRCLSMIWKHREATIVRSNVDRLISQKQKSIFEVLCYENVP